MNDMMRGNFDPMTGFGKQGDDTKAWATFRMHPVVDGVASNEQGRTIKKDVLYIKIIQPGENNTQVYDQPATNEDLQRFPRQFALFQANKEQDVVGSPLSLLFPDSPAIQENLKTMGFRTVEQLAAANDSALQNIGMGARQWQEKAKAYIEAADKGKDFHGLSGRLDSLELKLREKDDRIAALEAALAEATAKRGPGRPRSEAA